MATEVLMPKLGLTMTEGTVDQWFKNEGDYVEKGEVICTISSEKLTHDVEAPEAGVLSQLLVQIGEEVPCQQAIAIIGEGATKTQATESTEEVKTAEKEQIAPPVAKKVEPVQKNATDRIFITPLAKKIAESKGIDYRLITGTGGNGRITKRDVENYQPVAQNVASPTVAALTYGAGLVGMRKTIAERMMTSLNQTAQVTLHQKADVSKLMAFRAELKNKADMPLVDGQTSITTLLAKAVVLALKDTPTMNAWYHNGVYEQHDAVHLGMAVALPDGLVVPVVENADTMSLTTLGKTLNDRITKAQSGTLAGQHYTGSTFTITNIGKTGVEYFTPILNTPEVGILGVGTLMAELALVDGQVVEKQKLPLSLTFDHQVIDGAPAADFLAKVIYYLEHPYALVL